MWSIMRYGSMKINIRIVNDVTGDTISQLHGKIPVHFQMRIYHAESMICGNEYAYK